MDVDRWLRVAIAVGGTLATDVALGCVMELLQRPSPPITITLPEGIEVEVTSTCGGSWAPWAWFPTILFGISSLWCSVGGFLALWGHCLNEARHWSRAVAAFGLLGVLVGIAGAGYEYREGTWALDQLGEKATPREHAEVRDNVTGCLLRAGITGALGGIGLGALSLARRRVKQGMAGGQSGQPTPTS